MPGRGRPIWAGVAFRFSDGTLEAVEITNLTDAMIDVHVELPDFRFAPRDEFEQAGTVHVAVKVGGYGHRVTRFDEDMGARHQRPAIAAEVPAIEAGDE